ncbi:CD2 antigen cytoplasmic tail-binding protein 2 homolog [Atheta coriaria]|uniref:CD2 antigen cytoplasmic tail-binding protein 2 homolog n=1 Tax=Dalotia coriaria TaxID=877792 RepID=UPI0031F4310A
MSKRNIDELLENETNLPRKQVKFDDNVKKHTLDSDEEDDDKDKYNILDDNDIEGEEDASLDRQDGDVRMTAFNMTEEMEMGHFDKDGHFIWKNEKEVRDNWLDNVDWQRVNIANNAGDANAQNSEEKGLGDESDDDNTPDFDHITSYRRVITFLKPGETINKALKRLGGDLSKMSTIERIKHKKAGTLGSNKDVVELTELANGILTHLGNMDVYQETYEQIQLKLNNHDKKNKSKAHIVEAEFDMYSDDFDTKSASVSTSTVENLGKKEETEETQLMWEFKWDQAKDEIEGPFDTRQMNKWAEDGHFKTGVWVRKCGAQDSNFYSSNRIDFELYL